MGRKLSAKDAEKMRRRLEAKRKEFRCQGKYGQPKYLPLDPDDETCYTEDTDE